MSTKYTEDHEWLSVSGDVATLGITEHAAEELGELVYIELKEVGEAFAQGDEIAVIESVKAASEINAPVDGEIVEANTKAAETPALISENPEGDGWLYKIKISDASQLEGFMDLAAYKNHIAD